MSKLRSLPTCGDSTSSRGAMNAAEADRHVDEQHPVPAGPLGQHAAEQDAGRATGAGDRAPDPSALLRSAPSAKVAVTIEARRERAARRRGPAPRGRRSATARLWARPPASEASREEDEADDEHRRRPMRSARRPPSSRKPPNTSV